jgi:hypothetical protein
MPTPVKRQPWGQVSNKHLAVHRAGRFAGVVVDSGTSGPGFRPHGFQGPKCLIEKAKMVLSTEIGVLYYYDQVKRFK